MTICKINWWEKIRRRKIQPVIVGYAVDSIDWMQWLQCANYALLSHLLLTIQKPMCQLCPTVYSDVPGNGTITMPSFGNKWCFVVVPSSSQSSAISDEILQHGCWRVAGGWEGCPPPRWRGWGVHPPMPSDSWDLSLVTGMALSACKMQHGCWMMEKERQG